MNVADSAGKLNQWEIQKDSRGTFLLLDVPYKRKGQDSSEDLTITVAKDKMHKRPAFIAIIVPNNVEQADGILIKFSRSYKDENGKWNTEMDKSDPIRVPFEKCDNESKTCTVRIPAGYLVDALTNDKTDIFQRFMDFDHVHFQLIYADGSRNSVPVPLASFKEQYKSVAEADTPAYHQ